MTGWQLPSSQQVPKTPSMGSRGLSCPPRGALPAQGTGRAGPAHGCPGLSGGRRGRGGRGAPAVRNSLSPARPFPSCGRARWSRWHSGMRQRLCSSARGPRWEATARHWYHQPVPGATCETEPMSGRLHPWGDGRARNGIEREPPVRQLLALARLPQCSTKRVRMPPAALGGDAVSAPCS